MELRKVQIGESTLTTSIQNDCLEFVDSDCFYAKHCIKRSFNELRSLYDIELTDANIIHSIKNLDIESFVYLFNWIGFNPSHVEIAKVSVQDILTS